MGAGKRKFAADSTVEGAGFEPSVPREKTTLARQPAATGIPFGRKGADSFARGIDGSNTFPSGTGSVSRVFSAAVRCRIGRLGMIGSRSRTLWS
jgi:hypothetical protein